MVLVVRKKLFQQNSLKWKEEDTRKTNMKLTKSTPMVEMYDSVYVSSANRSNRHDFPTPESPINKSLNR